MVYASYSRYSFPLGRVDPNTKRAIQTSISVTAGNRSKILHWSNFYGRHLNLEEVQWLKMDGLSLICKNLSTLPSLMAIRFVDHRRLVHFKVNLSHHGRQSSGKSRCTKRESVVLVKIFCALSLLYSFWFKTNTIRIIVCNPATIESRTKGSQAEQELL